MSLPEDDDKSGSLLTDRQLQVLRLRREGLSQQEVAERMGTTRTNVSILEKRAHNNVHRAEVTLRQWMAIQAPINLRVDRGMDVFELPRMIFDQADQKGIKLPVNSLEILVQLRKAVPGLLEHRNLAQPVEVFVTIEGKLLVMDPLDKSPKGSD
jgi:Tfx family DNA-binding protein